MKKFMVLYHASKDAMSQMNEKSPEEMKAGMDLWHAWAQKCGSALLDLGAPLGVSQFIGSDSSSTVCGYSIVQAPSMDEAKALFEGHPHLGWSQSCSIEVLECMPMPGE